MAASNATKNKSPMKILSHELNKKIQDIAIYDQSKSEDENYSDELF